MTDYYDGENQAPKMIWRKLIIMLIGWFTVSGGNMTRIKVENKSRKQTVKVKTATTHANGPQNTTPLLKRIDELEEQVSELNGLTVKLAEDSVKEHVERFKLEQKVNESRRTNLGLVWWSWIVFAISMIIFGIVLN